MALNWRQVPGNFDEALYEFIKQTEAPDQAERLGINLVGGNPTIGVGFDLTEGGRAVQNAVLKELGFDEDVIGPDASPAVPPADGTPERREYDYIAELRVLMQNSESAASFNEVMQRRANDSNAEYEAFIPRDARRAEFAFANDAEVRSVFDDLWESTYKEGMLSRRPELESDIPFQTSYEMIILASITWNGGPGSGGIFGPGLRSAMIDGDRAKAWFELRYNSNSINNGTMRPGIAKRRYFESQVFGLYDNPSNVSLAEAENIFRLLQRKREEIISYEAQFGYLPDGRTATSVITINNQPVIPLDAASTDYSAFGVLGYAQSIPGSAQQISCLEHALNPARDKLLADMASKGYEDRGSWFDGENLVSTNIYMAATELGQVLDSANAEVGNYIGGVADLMIGGEIADTIKGNKGSDVLIGGLGNDTLLGGEGNDIIYGEDGLDSIIGGIGNDTIRGGKDDDYVDGEAGEDSIFGGLGNDTLQAGDGRDYLYGEEGNDLLIGGAEVDNIDGGIDNDTIRGGTGHDNLTGGAGLDSIIGGEGDDKLFGSDNSGGDTLEGGSGYDTYYVDDGDTIRDSDGQGSIVLNGKLLTEATRKKGETVYRDAAGNSYILSGTTLLVNDPLVVENFTSGDLGLTLKEELDPDDPDNPKLVKEIATALVLSSPIVLDLDGDGINTRGIGEGAFFDYDGNGFAERTGWINSGDGLLVRDINQDDHITTGAELFGNNTKLKSGQLASNGYIALADLDSNHDGKLDSQDTAWGELRIWQDIDNDGVSDSGELQRLEDLNIQTIGTTYSSNAITDSHGNKHLQQGSFTTADGTIRGTEDVWFRVNVASTRQDNLLQLSNAIRALPEIMGSGNVASLRQSMAGDTTGNLQDFIIQYVNAPDPAARRALVDQIIFAWAGTNHYTAINDRKIYTLEAFVGQKIDFSNRGPNAYTNVLNVFDSYALRIDAQLMQQSHYKEHYSAINYTWDEKNHCLVGDLSKTVPLFAAKLTSDHEAGKADISAFIKNLTLTNNILEFDARSFIQALSVYGQDVVDVAIQASEGRMSTNGSDYSLVGTEAPDVIFGWAGNDVISGYDGNDRLFGGEGSDTLYGSNGNDTLDGGASNDLLDGGQGNDIYLFGRGSGRDTIQNSSDVTAKYDVLRLSPDITVDDIVISRNGENLTLTIRNTSDQLTVVDYFINDGASARGLEAVEFANGAIWKFDSIISFLPPTTTSGDDLIRSYNADEIIDGLGGNDVIYSYGGSDTLIGGAGNDTLYGGDGNDVFNGGTGNDSLRGDSGNDIYLFGPGSGVDTLVDYDTTAGNIDTVRLTVGVAPADVKVTRDHNHLYLSLNNGADRLELREWFYEENFGENPYKIERLLFEDGTQWDVSELISRIEFPLGTNNADIIYANYADNILDGLDGRDYLNGYGGNDTLIGGAGNDELSGGADNDVLDGGTGDDGLNGGTGNDIFMFGKGDGQDSIFDTAQIGALNVLQFKPGVAPDEIVATFSGSSLVLSIAGTPDRIRIPFFSSNNQAIQQLKFDDGTILDIASLKGNLLAGTSGADTIYGGELADTINGQAGNDILYSGPGNDVLDGGADNDTLDGGTGNNIYLFGKGDGQDTINYDIYSRLGRLNVLQFKEGVTPSEILATRLGDDLLLTIVGTTDAVKIQSFFYGADPKGVFNPIQLVKFSDGTSWDIPALISKALTGTTAADTINGTLWADIISGLSGADTVSGGAGDDVLNGGADNDFLTGDADVDLLEGGTGNDTLAGGTGNDTYLFGKGDGQDTINYDYDSALGRLNALQFKEGVVPSEILVTRLGDDLLLTVVGTTDAVKIQRFFYGADPEGVYNPVQLVKFSDGTSWDILALTSKALTGTTAADTINGTLRADIISGLSGADTLNGGVGDDVLNGGADNDFLTGGSGVDLLDGGTGNDTLAGDIGNDTYLFGKGDGQDTINYDNDSALGRLNVLQFKEGVVPSDILVTRLGNDLLLTVVGTTDAVKIQHFFYGADPEGVYNPVQLVKFSDGTCWDIHAITSKALAGTTAADTINGTLRADIISGLAGADTLYGDAGDDVLNGDADNDFLMGGAGVDLLDGGTGNDTLVGNTGSDTYLFGKGDGQDTIRDSYDPALSTLNVLQFKEGVTPDEIEVTAYYSELVLSIAGTADKVTIESFLNGTSHPLQQVKFSDGTIWDAAALVNKLFAGTSGFDFIRGTPGADTINGQAGDDTLDGGAGNDFLNGGIGNDYLAGGEGDDIYIFGKGDGQDLIKTDYFSKAGSLNVLQFKEGIEPRDIVAERSSSDLVLSIAGTSDKITLEFFFYENDPTNAYSAIKQIKFSDGSSWDINELRNKYLEGTAAPDSLRGGSGADSISGQAGADHLYGEAGDDVLNGGADNDYLEGGDGNDSLYGGTGADTLYGSVSDDLLLGDGDNDYLNGDDGNDSLDGGTGNDTLLGFVGDDLLLGGGDNDYLIGYDGNDMLDGGAGIDNLTGGAGNDRLDGGSGNDSLLGGEGDDTYIVDSALDVLTENGNEGVDSVESSVNLTLGSNIENLTLLGTIAMNGTGNELDNLLTGNSASNTLTGGAGNDRIDGGSGTDSMIGGTGNDTYVVDNTADSISESSSGGTDTIESSISWLLGSNLENLMLTGSASVNANGNTLANTLHGNSGNNRLDGGAGNDSMLGGLGDDIYVVERAADVIVEGAGEGIDTIESSITLTLGNNVENLILTGSSGLSGMGNALDNILVGNSGKNTLTGGAGNDRLDGGAGNDTMRGGLGNDTYVVNTTSDVVTENANEGKDTIESSVTLTLGNHVENLTLTGAGALNGTGNALDNALKGNAGNNSLTGAAGNDTLEGQGGNDTLTGGAGNDTYLLGRGHSTDTVVENDSAVGNTDVARFLESIAADQLWFRKLSNNLEVSIIGTSDKLTVKDWFLGNAYHVEQLHTSDGQVLLDSRVQNLVNAMAAFAPPAAGQTSLPENYQAALASVIAANWQ